MGSIVLLFELVWVLVLSVLNWLVVCLLRVRVMYYLYSKIGVFDS